MNRKIALATASLFAMSALAGPALAGGVGVGVGADGSAGVSAPGVSAGADGSADASGGSTSTNSMSTDQGVTGAIGATADVGTAVSAIGADTSGEVESMTEVSSVNVVKLGDLSAEGEAEGRIEAAIDENEQNIDALQAAIEANAAVKGELETQDVDSSDVVAAKTEADGSLTVYVQ